MSLCEPGTVDRDGREKDPVVGTRVPVPSPEIECESVLGSTFDPSGTDVNPDEEDPRLLLRPRSSRRRRCDEHAERRDFREERRAERRGRREERRAERRGRRHYRD